MVNFWITGCPVMPISVDVSSLCQCLNPLWPGDTILFQDNAVENILCRLMAVCDADLGWGLLSQFPVYHNFPQFSALWRHALATKCHIYIWQVSPQLSCGGTCQIYKQRVLMHGHQGWNVRHGLCHIYMIYVYIWVVYSFCLFCCLFIIVTAQFVALYKPCKPKPKFR